MEGNETMGQAVKLTDNRKVFKSVYQLKADTIEILEIPDLQFLMLEGEGKLNIPGEGNFWVFWRLQNQLRSLTSKKIQYNFRHMPLEMLWHERKENGDPVWTAMVQLPNEIDDSLFQEAFGKTTLRLILHFNLGKRLTWNRRLYE
jgi:hypothetical protein